MYKSQIKTWFTLAFISLFVQAFGQTITTHNSTFLTTENSVNEIYDSYFFDKEIVLLTDSRKDGQLDILIVTLNQNKAVIREQIIGTNEAHDRPVGLIKNKNGYWLCANSVQNGKRIFTLYELDKTFVPINNKSIPIKNLDEVTALKYDENNQTLFFTATLLDAKGNMYPRLIKYDLTNHMITKSLDFNNRTDKEIDTIRKDTVGTVAVERYLHHFKECNQIKCMDDNCSEILLTGQEVSSDKVKYEFGRNTDFWVVKIKNNRIVWEKIYKTRSGGDIGFDIFFNKKSNRILVGGIGYNKTMKEMHDFDYHYRTIQLDENGELLEVGVHKAKSNKSSRYLQMKPIGNDYIISGRTQDAIYEEHLMPKITQSNLYLVLVNKNGDLKAEKVIKTQSVDILYSSVVLSDKKMLLIFSPNEKDKEIKILEVSITE